MADPGPGDLTGRRALVTGAGRGIGRATALRLAERGATVLVNDVNGEAAAGVVDEVGARGGTAHLAVADITDAEQVRAVVAAHPPIGILVNNAGGALPGSRWDRVAETRDGDWEAFLSLNLTSAFHCAREVLPGMLALGRGHIVSVGSISGTNGQTGGAGYAAAKAGLAALVSSVAKETASRGISCNGIIVGNAPHHTRTDDRQALLDSWVHLGRVGRHDEFAAAIAFLCSEDSSYLSGAMIPVDGGFHKFRML